MRKLAWRSLSSCLIAALAACTSSTVGAPAPSRTQPAPAAVTSTAAGVRPAPVPPATTRSVVAVVTGYYQAIVTRNYRMAFGYLAPAATGPDGQRLTQGSFLQLARMLDGMGGRVTRFAIGASPSGVVMTLYRVRYGPYHAHLRMARTRQGWAISSVDRI
jgi:ABC-type Fe3+-hydroxamate transport system substrate-binding protein